VKNKLCCQQSAIFAFNAPSKPTAQYHQTICAVKSNPAHLQHSNTLEKQESKGGYFNQICILFVV